MMRYFTVQALERRLFSGPVPRVLRREAPGLKLCIGNCMLAASVSVWHQLLPLGCESEKSCFPKSTAARGREGRRTEITELVFNLERCSSPRR